jgi:NACHT domain
MSIFRDINSIDARRAAFHNVGRDQINADHVNFISHTTGAIQCYSCAFTVYTHILLEPLQLLNPVPDAAYDSIQGGSECMEGTRQEVVGKLMLWIDGDTSDQPLCWLNGAAGAGKSAISRTVARLCEESNRLCASFFFFRGAGRRSTITHFISTIAYSIALSIPATRPYIEDALQRDHHILHRSHKRQFQQLIVEPIRLAISSVRPWVIIIDALDECDDRQQIAKFIDIVACAFQGSQKPLPLRFFFTSRVEEHIRSKFAASPALDITYCLNLQEFHAGNDIRTFLRSHFTSIYQQKRRQIGNISLPWPSQRDLDELVTKSMGSFIFAFTLANFVDDGSDLPHRKLQTALHSHSGLDPLYTQVLESASRGHHFTRVLQAIIIIPTPISITGLACLLQIEGGDVIHALQGVQSIIMVPENDEQSVQLLHTSLRDFLTTQTRSQHLFIKPATCHLSMAIDCLSSMTAHHGDIIYEIEILQYAARNWCHHLFSAVKESGAGAGAGVYLLSQDDAFVNTLIGFLSGSFDPWMNSIIFQIQIKDIVKILDSLLQVGIIQHCINIEWSNYFIFSHIACH